MNADLRAGAVIAEAYRLDALIGQGGTSQVWRAEAMDGRAVVVKLPRPSLADQRGARELIRREFSVLGGLAHPHVVSPLDLIRVGRSPALVTEYLGGGDLLPLCGSHPRHWLGAARDVADALDHVHGRGVIHRDVKPRNVLLRDHRHATLIDFALASAPGTPAPRGGGTPAYQSPAKLRGEVSASSDDIHAFAALLYELGSGRLPFGAHPGSARRVHGPLPLDFGDGPPALAELARLIMAALGPDPTQGPGSMSAFLNVLESAVKIWR